MSVIQHFVLRHHRRIAAPGYEIEDDHFLYWLVGGIVLVLLGLIIAIHIDRHYAEATTYVVDGRVVGYGVSTGKVKRTTVYLQQYDGLREYSTDVQVAYCVRSPLGTSVPVQVTTEINSLTGHKRQRVALVYNPCKESK